MAEALEADIAAEAKEAIQMWLDHKDDYEGSKQATDLAAANAERMLLLLLCRLSQYMKTI